jgi:tyrosine-specific transport protein
LIVIILLIVVVLLIGIFSLGEMHISNLLHINPAKFFMPYGVILFAFIGTAAIPELQEVLGKEKHHMKKAIIWGSLIPAFLYILFTAVVVSVVGLENFQLLEPNQRIATIALSIYANSGLGLFANIFAILAMFTSSLTLGLALLEMYHFDYKFSRNVAFALTVIIPFIIAMSKITTFIAVIGITGAIAGGVDGILIVLAYWKAKKNGERTPEYALRPPKILGWALITLLSLGIMYQLALSLL